MAVRFYQLAIDAHDPAALALGATPADIGQGDVPWMVLHDPEGNEFCILTPHTSLVE